MRVLSNGQIEEMFFNEDSFEAFTIYDALIHTASKEIGYETGPDYSKYGEWYGSKSAQWCNIFVSWVADQVGELNVSIPRASYTEYSKNWYVKNDAFELIESGYIPNKADLIFFREMGVPENRTVTHVGFVVECKDNILVTIEGNKYKYWPDDSVREVNRYVWTFQKDQSQREYEIVGFADLHKVIDASGRDKYYRVIS